MTRIFLKIFLRSFDNEAFEAKFPAISGMEGWVDLGGWLYRDGLPVRRQISIHVIDSDTTGSRTDDLLIV